MGIATQVIAGEQLAVSRLLSLVENHSPEAEEALEIIYPHTGNAHIIGITGPSGSGKSTLVNRLALELVEGIGKPVGIIAVDPTSPFSGGALLGDRVRMRDLASRNDIFIRSMATRGALGGLALAANEAAQVLDAAGYDPLLVETVGAGQAEVDIARLAHTVVVVEAPGLGDDIQAVKAGILEIADILVVNKADKPAAEAAANSLRAMLEMGEELRIANGDDSGQTWKVPLVKTSALNGEGIPDLSAAIHAHKEFLKASGEWSGRERQRALELFERLLRDKLYTNWHEKSGSQAYKQTLEAIAERKISPREAIRQLFK